MSKKPLGPGPGAYGLPTGVGFGGHDIRKNRLPQYSFAPQTKIIDKRVSPGPGAYKVEGITRYGYNKAHIYTMAPLTPIPEKSKGPGPGAHDVHVKPFFKGVNAPAYSMVWKNHFQFKNCAPGPNVYMFPVQPIKPGIPAYSMGLTNKIVAKPNSPGPATYGRMDLNVKLPKSPIYSMTARNLYQFKNCAPGSNVYNLAEHHPGDTQPIYSFGVRHSEYAPPMIIECDNM